MNMGFLSSEEWEMGDLTLGSLAALTAGAATPTSYLTAINTTLANGSFSARQNGTIDQWESVGNVAATPAVAFHAVTLGESTRAQAHLAQAFVLSAQDRFLTFTVRHADRIIVMRAGQIVEIGNHDTLIQQDGQYARLYQMGMQTGEMV